MLDSTDLTRRQILGGTAAALGGLSAASFATASKPKRYNVGIESPAAETAAEKAANSVERTFDWGGGKKAITGTFPEEALDGLRNRPGVRYVEEDAQVEALGQTTPWGVDRVDAEVAHANGDTGEGSGDGVHVAVLDSGIDPDHPDLQANLGTGHALVECAEDCTAPWDDDLYHGTHCAGTVGATDDDGGVVGVAPGVTLHAVKVLDQYGRGQFSVVAEGIRLAADRGYDVVSMSLGGWKTRVVEDAVEYAYEKGVVLVAAAGNAGPCSDCVGYPAGEPEVIAVSATNDEDDLAWFSSAGPEVDLAAPGHEVLSTMPDGDYEKLSGTSMACPHVSGAAAQLVAEGHDHRAVRDALEESAEDVGLASEDQGYGLLDVAAALDHDSSDSEADLDDVETADPVVQSLDATGGTGPQGTGVEVAWSVADPDGDLDSADLNLYELDGIGLAKEAVDTATVAVGGQEDAGTTVLETDGDPEGGYELELVVEDERGNLGADAVEWGPGA